MNPEKTPSKPSNSNQSATPKLSPVSPPYAHAGAKAPGPMQPATPPPGWQEVYLCQLAAKGGQIVAASEAAQVSVRTVQRLRLSDAAFARAERESMELARDILESEVRRRAVDGVERFRYNKDGVVIGYERVYSDMLLLRLLEKNETGSWRQKHQVETGSSVGFATAADRKAEMRKAMEDMAATGDIAMAQLLASGEE